MQPLRFAVWLVVFIDLFFGISCSRLTACDSALYGRSGEIYYNRWDVTKRNCSWTFHLPNSDGDEMLLLKFVHLRYINRPGLTLPDGTDANGVVGRHLYIDTSTEPWCGIFIPPTAGSMTSCEIRARDFCKNSIHVGSSWPPVLRASGSNTIFFATYLYVDCNATPLLKESVKFQWRHVGIVFIVISLLLLLILCALIARVYRAKSTSAKKGGKGERGESAYEYVRSNRRPFAKSISQTALISRDRLTSNSEAAQEFEGMLEERRYLNTNKDSVDCEPTCCAPGQIDHQHNAGDKLEEVATSSRMCADPGSVY